MNNIKETEEFIEEVVKLVSEEEKEDYTIEKNGRIFTFEELLKAKFGFLELAYDKETALEKAQKIIDSRYKKVIGVEEIQFKEKAYIHYRTLEDTIDKFLLLFKFNDVDDFLLKGNDVLFVKDAKIFLSEIE